MKQTSCRLCDALNSNIVNQHISNTILRQTENFVLVPALGPLVEGHLMIVSKEHYPNLASMDEGLIEECLSFISILSKFYSQEVLFSEHGSYHDQTGGSCIEHTHIHVFPNLGHYFSLLDGILPVNKKSDLGFNSFNLKTLDFPYILTYNGIEEFRIYESYNAHSQMMRKAIANILGISEWDWKHNEKLELIEKSIENWRLSKHE